jgi:hypothetical protein
MAAVEIWLKDNWFTLLQSIGIVSGLIFTGLASRRETKARTVTDLLALTAQHRELWSELHRRPDLFRLIKKDVDLVAEPISAAEHEYLNTVFVHFHTGWLLSRQGVLATEEALAADVKDFFALPIPRHVWNETKHTRDTGFRNFVEQSLAE